ncbi:MAG: hypothetical protein AVDCRST_MAG53-3138, partial [uncultured Solirubrobacteraceae bacterium]
DVLSRKLELPRSPSSRQRRRDDVSSELPRGHSLGECASWLVHL